MKKHHVPNKQELMARKIALAKVLVNRKRKIAPQVIALAVGMGKDGYSWVTAQFRVLESADLMKQHSRVRWSVVPGTTAADLYRALGITAGTELPLDQTSKSPVGQIGSAIRALPPKPSKDLFRVALKAEYFDRLILKYGPETLKSALGITELP